MRNISYISRMELSINSLARCILTVLTISIAGGAVAQGCSDAGFCTVPGLKPGHDPLEAPKNSLEIGISYGSADRDISVIGPFVEYTRRLSDQFDVNAKLTALGQSGNDISTFGI